MTLEPRYSRAPSDDLQKLLQSGGFLSPIILLSGEKLKKYSLPFDVHFRRNDEIHVYCGHARIFTARLSRRNTVKIDAHATYQKDHEEFFRDWNIGETDFTISLERYLNNVNIPSRLFEKEGKLQADWSRMIEPWVPFDREAVLSYAHIDSESRSITFSAVESARSILKDIALRRPGRDGKPWAEPKGHQGNELDQLAVDKEGNLVLIEIKDAGAGSAQVFYAPLQLLQYIHEWRRAFGWLSVSRALQELIDTRVALGLMPEVPPLTGGIRAAVCFGEDTRSEEVKRRYYEALGVINAHLPAHVLPVETWSYVMGKPQSL